MRQTTNAKGELRSRPFVLLVVATALSFFGYTLLLPLVPLWAVHGGAQAAAAGTTTTVFMAATVLAQFASPRLIQRIGYSLSFALGSAVLGAPTPLYALTSALPALLAISILRGIGFGLLTVSGSALVAELLPRELLGRGSGVYGIAVGVPTLVGLPAGVWLSHRLGFWLVFLLAGVLPVLASIPALSLPRLTVAPHVDAHANRPSERSPWGAMLTPWLVMLAVALGFGGVVTFLPIALRGAQNISALVLFAIGAAMLLGRLLSGVVGDRLQLAGRQLSAGIVIATSGLLLIALGTHVYEGASMPGAAAALTVTGAALFAGGFGVLQNDSLVVMFHRVKPTHYGFASAVWNVGYDSGTGVGAVVIGAMVARTGYVTAFLASAVLLLGVLPSTVISIRRTG